MTRTSPQDVARGRLQPARAVGSALALVGGAVVSALWVRLDFMPGVEVLLLSAVVVALAAALVLRPDPEAGALWVPILFSLGALVPTHVRASQTTLELEGIGLMLGSVLLPILALAVTGAVVLLMSRSARRRP